MRIVLFLLLISVFQTIASAGYSQSAKITLKSEELSLVDVLSKIEDQSEYRFIYDKSQVNLDKKVKIDFDGASVKKVLEELFVNQGINYMMIDTQIILSNSSSIALQQLKAVSGKVTDSSGVPLPGVTVLIKGTTQGIITDIDGKYSLANVPGDATLIFSFVGMKTQEIAINEKTLIDAVLEEETIGLEEVVAIGYGTARRKDITGSVGSVNMEESPVSVSPNFNVLSALKATVPGLNIGTVNKAGGSPSSMLIRGQNSISGSNDPLIVLDGVIYLGDISDINTNDIASFDILKDASATAVYGSRAANGVIIITSRKGKTSKPTIRLKASTGINVWQQKPQIMSAEQYLAQRMDRSEVDTPLDIPELKVPERENYQNGIATDWLSLGSRVGINQDYQLSVSGSGKGINYFLSTGYNEQTGVIVGDEFEQFSLRGKIDTDITDWLEIGIDGSYSYRDNSGIGADLSSLLGGSPYGDVYLKNWNKKVLEKYPIGESVVNPLWNTDKSIVDDLNHSNFYRASAYANVKIPFIEGLSYKFSYVRGNNGVNTERFYHEGYYVNEGYGTVDPEERYGEAALQAKLSSANGTTGRRNTYDYVWDNIINYKRQFNDHYINATLVATRDYRRDKYIEIEGSDFASNGNTILGANGLHKAEVQTYEIILTEEANIGYLARMGYSLKDKYHLTASFRRDGSSVFGTDKKWGNFPSVGLAWTASEENFFKSIDILDYLKIRASYGKNGNQGIDAYSTLTTMSSGKDGGIGYEFSNNPSSIQYGMKISTLGNSYLGWETTTAFNGGFESVFRNNTIFFNLDFYFSQTKDQLFERNIPIMTGFSSITSSMGQVNNHGIEISLKTVNIKKNNFYWESSLTFWQNRNILKKLYGDDIDGDGSEDDDIGNELFIGKSLGAIYGYEFDGIVQEEDTEYMNNTGAEPGHVKFKDISGPDGVPDGEITSTYDRKIIGYKKENCSLSFSNTLKHKNFELYILLSGILGGGKNNYYMLDNVYAFRMQLQPGYNNWDHPWWTASNRNNSYPSTSYFDERFSGIQCRSFLKVQDISLSYRFNHSLLKRLNIESLKVYSSIQNLYTFTGWEGGDPEQGVQAMSDTYPVPAIYTIGLDISF